MKTDGCFYKAAIISFPSQIGWRRWRGPRQDLDTPLYTNVLNFLYPSFIFFLMVAAPAFTEMRYIAYVFDKV